MSQARRAFNAEYYRRFYEDPATRSMSDDEVDRHVRFIAAYLDHLGVAVGRILDMGCGTGMMRQPLLAYFPRARYLGVDHSEYACREYGWTRGSVIDFESTTPFDLVICHDVLQYLNDRNAARAINNLSRLCASALVLAVLTEEDWEGGACDPERTDQQVYLRTNAWYRKRLARELVNVGGGVFLRRDASPVLWSLEHLD